MREQSPRKENFRPLFTHPNLSVLCVDCRLSTTVDHGPNFQRFCGFSFSMNETTMLLSPSPGDPNATPDFLATVEPVPKHPPFSLPFELVLGYTRESWSSYQQHKHHASGNEWQCCYLVSTDGRNRLPGFLKYLRDRKKSAIAKFEDADVLTSPGGKSMLVVPHDPPPIPADLPAGVDAKNVFFVQYLKDDAILKRGDGDRAKKREEQNARQHKQHQHQQQLMQQRKTQQQQPLEKKKTPTQLAVLSSNRKGGGGILGGLLGAQRRTENHLHVVRSQKSSTEAAFDPNAGVAGCINQFRARISADLDRFKADPAAFHTKVTIDLASLLRSVPAEHREKLGMDAFKFAVYEQVRMGSLLRL